MTQAKRLPPFIKDLRAKVRSGDKTKTQRPMKVQPENLIETTDGELVPMDADNKVIKCPFGQPGDIRFMIEPLIQLGSYAAYRDDGETVMMATACPIGGRPLPWAWQKPLLTSIHMSTVAARTFVRLTDVHVQRVQDISEEDAIAEGSFLGRCPCSDMQRKSKTPLEAMFRQTGCHIHGTEFSYLWNSIYAKPRPVYGRDGTGLRVIKSYISYPWEDVQETREHKGKPWHVWGNPYNWALSWEPHTPTKEMR